MIITALTALGIATICGLIMALLPTYQISGVNVLVLAAGLIGIGALIVFSHIALCSLHGALIFKRRVISLVDGSGEYVGEKVQINGQKAVVHRMKLPTSAIYLQLTDATNLKGEFQCLAETTFEALTKSRADIIINASFFYPFKDIHLFCYEPHRGDPLTVVGETISNKTISHKTSSHKIVYGLRKKRAAFVVYPDDSLAITESSSAIAQAHESGESPVKYMACGRAMLISQGRALDIPEDGPYPRTAMGLSQDRKTLWLIVVDGKQPFYSNGLSLRNLTQYMRDLGVHDALEMDGGGSATLARRNPKTKRRELLNRPCHTKIPFRQRPIANHWLIYWR